MLNLSCIRFGGLILTHYEVGESSPIGPSHCLTDGWKNWKGDEGNILPAWTAVDTKNVHTPREVADSLIQEGWGIEVCFVIYQELEMHV